MGIADKLLEMVTGQTACQRDLNNLYKNGYQAEEAYAILKAKGYNASEIKQACIAELNRLGEPHD